MKNAQTKKRPLCSPRLVVAAAIALALAGARFSCLPREPEPEELAREELCHAVSLEVRKQSAQGRPLPSTYLTEKLGKPNLVVTPAELMQHLEDDSGYREAIVAGLWRSYLYYIEDSRGVRLSAEERSRDWRQDAEFANSAIWIYEAVEVDEGLKSIFGPKIWAARAFIVIESRVVRSSSLIPWRAKASEK